MKIIHKKRTRKGKVGISFRRIGELHYKEMKRQEQIKALCFNWDSFNFDDFKAHLAQVLHTYKEQNKKNLPLVIVGDAKFPPLPLEIKRYYLVYNPDNFIGEYEMMIYGENAYLTFFLNYPEDFDKYKHIINRTAYLGSTCKILLICNGDAVLPQKKIVNECINDYKIVIMKEQIPYLPCHKYSKSFEYLIPKNL